MKQLDLIGNQRLGETIRVSLLALEDGSVVLLEITDIHSRYRTLEISLAEVRRLCTWIADQDQQPQPAPVQP